MARFIGDRHQTFYGLHFAIVKIADAQLPRITLVGLGSSEKASNGLAHDQYTALRQKLNEAIAVNVAPHFPLKLKYSKTKRTSMPRL